MTGHTPFVEALRAELVAAAERLHAAGAFEVPAPPRRRARALVRTAAAAVLLAAGAAVVAPLAAPVQADIRVERQGDRLVVTLRDLEHRADHIELAARAAGLDIRVVEVPAGPSRVGRFVLATGTGVRPPELRTVGADGSTFAGFSVPADWTGSLTLQVGRPARAGEAYQAHSDALAPGEPLACAPVLGAHLRDALPDLRRADADIVLTFASTVTGVRSVHLDDPLPPEGASWVVAGATATSATDVVVLLVEPGTPLPRRAASGARC